MPIALNGVHPDWSCQVLGEDGERVSHQGGCAASDGKCSALTSSEQELRLLVEAIPTLVWRAAPDGNFEYVNKRMLEYLGAPLGEVISWG